MAASPNSLEHLVDKAKTLGPVRVAVADAAQGLVIETLREAHTLGLVEPRLIGIAQDIRRICREAHWDIAEDWIVPTAADGPAAARAVELVRGGEADAVMKGHLHTDTLMHALLDKERGLRAPGRRVSHVFIVELPSYPKLLGITDAAINIAPDITAKAQILQNAIELFLLLGAEQPKVAILSAVETVNPDIVSTLDAACLTLMARRGQIHDAIVDGPLAFDNAISASAAAEKGITSEVAGCADILLMPDLVSGNILAKNLGYLGGGVIAGAVVGLTAPVILTSRADPPAARLASLALAVVMHHKTPGLPAKRGPVDAHPQCAAQPECACCPVPG